MPERRPPRQAILLAGVVQLGCLAAPPESIAPDAGAPPAPPGPVLFDPGRHLGGSVFEHVDGGQGTLILRFRPEADVAELTGATLLARVAGLVVAIEAATGSLVVSAGTEPITAVGVAAGWLRGELHLVVVRWDWHQPLSGMSHVSLAVDGGEAVFGAQEIQTVELADVEQVIGGDPAAIAIDSALLLRRPIWDSGSDTGVRFEGRDEQAEILAAGAAGDPTEAVGSWDVVFGLSPHGDPATGQPFLAWSHPHGSNLIAPGGLVQEGDIAADGWFFTAGTAGALRAATGSIYGGGYRVEDGTLSRVVPVGPAEAVHPGDAVMLRVVASGDGGGGAPTVCIATVGGACLASATGRQASTPASPDVLIATAIAPAEDLEVRLITAESDTPDTPPAVTWHEAELHRDLLVNPSFESWGGELPDGWQGQELTTGEATPGGMVHSGAQSAHLESEVVETGSPDNLVQSPADMEDLSLYLIGGFFLRENSAPAGIEAPDGRLYQSNVPFDDSGHFRAVSAGPSGSYWHVHAVGKRLSTAADGAGGDQIHWGGTTPGSLVVVDVDDAYVIRLEPVEIKVGM